ncbi:MAG: TIM barrel protein [Phycisphaerae bacterium]|nr:TIM barrel protein [Phycisphaerae bacterium]
MNASPHTEISRRSFIKTSAAGLAATGLTPALLRAAQQGAPKKIPIGLQLYSVRHQCAKDLKGVLEAVGKMGYQGVEFAGYYGKSAEELRKMMDANNLLCCGTHTGLETLLGDYLDKTIAFNKTLGNKYLIVPGLPHARTRTRQAWLDTAKLFNEIADKVKDKDMRVGYHAHGGDFKKFGDQTAWDLFFSNAKPEVVMQLDIGNCMGGGGDPVAILKKFPGRATTIHLKEHGGSKYAVIGEGDAKWKEIFALCEAGGTQWYIVEHERGGPDPVGDVKRCLEALRKMGK